MPDGLLQWYDARLGEGRVVRGGRQYPVRAEDMEPHARVPGARVHFDVKRDQGVSVAVDVRLREGTRVSRRQRRFGDMAGARRPDMRGSAPFARPHPELGRRLPTQPMVVVRRWADLVAGDDAEAAALLYAPDAVVHSGAGDVRGRKVRGWLSASGLPGQLRSIDIAGTGELIALHWTGDDRRRATTWIRVAHGEIAEQWIEGSTPPAALRVTTAAEGEPPIDVTAEDPTAEATVDYARQKVRRALAVLDEPVLHTSVILATAPDPAVERPALVKATVDVDGDLVRAHVAARTMTEAVDLLERRLRAQLEHRAERTEALRHLTGEVAEPGQWRHGQPVAERPQYYERPPEDRQVVRRKTFAVEEMTVDEAAFDMEQLDFDFYLFRELSTGSDVLLFRLPEGRYGLRRLRVASVDASGAAVEVETDPELAPTLTLAEAREWLGVAGEPYVFYADAESGRGTVLYLRYDGHYGLITPE